MTKTIEEMFEELKYIPSGLGCMDKGCEGCEYEEKERKNLEIEITKQIQSELLKEVLNKRHQEISKDGLFVSEIVWVGDIKKLAEENGIEL